MKPKKTNLIPKSNIQALVKKIANSRGISVEMTASNICQKYRRLAPGIIHPNILDHSFPKHFKNNTLTVAAKNSAWAQEIHMHSHLLLESLQKESSPVSIKRIKVLVESTHINTF